MLKINDANDFRRTAAGLSLIAGPLLVSAGAVATTWEVSGARSEYRESPAASPTAQAQVAADLPYCVNRGHRLRPVPLSLAAWRGEARGRSTPMARCQASKIYPAAVPEGPFEVPKGSSCGAAAGAGCAFRTAPVSVYSAASLRTGS